MLLVEANGGDTCPEKLVMSRPFKEFAEEEHTNLQKHG